MKYSIWRSRRGNEMVEASFVIPCITLVTMILLRLFIFYVEIVVTGVQAHELALAAWAENDTEFIDIYEATDTVEMFPSGYLTIMPSKDIYTKAYLLNEDRMVRAKEVLNE